MRACISTPGVAFSIARSRTTAADLTQQRRDGKMTDERLKVLGISGSLRKGSYNTAALRAAQELAPPDMTIETFGLGEIPLYNEDVRAAGFPPIVQQLRDRI